MHLNILETSAAFNIFISITALIVTVLLIFFLLYKTRKEAKRYRESNDNFVEGMMSRADFLSELSYYITRVGEDVGFTLFMFDIDEFSQINDSLGRGVGDIILQEIGKRLVKRCPHRSNICRYKNDEFLVLVKNEYTRAEIDRMAQIILNDISEEMILNRDVTLKVTCSAGIAFYPLHGNNSKNLLQSLELATYVSKRNGGNKHTVYSSEIADESSNLAYFQEIKLAIQNKEFCLYYQPMMNIKNHKLIGFEALLRWNHPTHGVLSPLKFINIMEQSGDIHWVGQWGLESIIKQLLEWQAVFPSQKLMVSINLSPKQVLKDNVADVFKNILKKYEIDPSCICLELNEFAVFEKMGQMRINLIKLRDLGFKISIDGFELDYSTLTKLTSTPVDVIKLDREFVSNYEDQDSIAEKFVQMLVEYAYDNNKLLVAEGVENQDMEHYILENNIQTAQGYFYSKPVPVEEATNFIVASLNNVSVNEVKSNE